MPTSIIVHVVRIHTDTLWSDDMRMHTRTHTHKHILKGDTYGVLASIILKSWERPPSSSQSSQGRRGCKSTFLQPRGVSTSTADLVIRVGCARRTVSKEMREPSSSILRDIALGYAHFHERKRWDSPHLHLGLLSRMAHAKIHLLR